MPAWINTCPVAGELVVMLCRGWREQGACVGGGVDRGSNRTHHGAVSVRWWGVHTGETRVGARSDLGEGWVGYNGAMMAGVQGRRAWKALDQWSRYSCSWRMHCR